MRSALKIVRLSLLFLFCLLMQQAIGQRFGLPGISNYTRSEYKGGTQSWAVSQSEDGLMYFANNDGLIEYDGAHWSVYRDMELIYRSLCVDKERIYVGAFNNFGYYEPNSGGVLRFHSLLPLLKGRINDFDEIWRIHNTSQGIIFQSFKAIFIYHEGKIDIVYPRSKFHFSYYVNGILWVYDENQGLMQLREGKVRQSPGGSFFSGTEIWTILPLDDDKVLIGTAKKGVFIYDGEKVIPWNNPVNELLKRYQIFSGAVINKKYFAFGTIQNGFILSDTSGQVIFHLNKEKGILNNTVLCIGNDRQGDIWLGLDNGISCAHINSPLTYIQNYFDIGSGYCSARFGDEIYLGTNQGLFYIPWRNFIDPLKKKEDFKLIEGTEGQVWSLSIIDNTLLCGHNFGVFQIVDKKAIKISTVPGGWSFLKINRKQPFIVVGHYSGLSVLIKKGNLWSYRNELKGYDQSSHYIALDAHGDIWISHGYKGIYRVKTDSLFTIAKDIRFYDTRDGLPTKVGNNLFRLHSGLVIGSKKGVYRFNDHTSKFEPDSTLKQLITGDGQIDYLAEDQGYNIWYFQNHQPGVLRQQEDGSLKNIISPFAELKGQIIAAYGHVNALDVNNVLIGIEGGFAHYVSGQFKDFGFLPVLHISSLHSSDTAEGNYRFNSIKKQQKIIPEFRYANNTIFVSFAASQYADKGINFQFKLEGFDQDWSGWNSQNSKEYTNLPHGEYTFMLKAKTDSGQVTPVLTYKFRILPPWYSTLLAWFFYFIAFLILVAIAYRFFMKSLEKSRLQEKHTQNSKYQIREQQLKEEALITEKEMIRLRNEKLNLEMIHKEKELANSTLMIIQKNEILHRLRSELTKIKNNISEDNQKNELNSTLKRIGKEIDNEKQWQVFNTHVEQVHESLFKKLKEDYPDLTPRELSLCAYLRMNISSKEIATLMNISTRGVEISRYRIRKKLGLDRNANLTEFMMKL
jgi:DNA-binding CsgD family transcriptional regulator